MSVKEKMSREFIVLSGEARIEEAVQVLQAKETPHVILALVEGNFAVMPYSQLKDTLTGIADKLGSTILSLALNQIPGLPGACQPVDVESGIGEARRLMCRSPGRCTVVFEKGAPVGVLYQTTLGITGDVPRLYGPRFPLFKGDVVNALRPPRRCPSCQGEFDFYEPRIEGGVLQYHCPHCGYLFEDVEE